MEIAYPTLVSTDSHDNGERPPCSAGVSTALRQKLRCSASYSMVLPEVIGVKLTGKLRKA